MVDSHYPERNLRKTDFTYPFSISGREPKTHATLLKMAETWARVTHCWARKKTTKLQTLCQPINLRFRSGFLT